MRVAIVEDDGAAAARLQEYLERFAREQGLTIETARFADGIHLAEHYRAVWDLILLDVEMPLLDGVSTAQRIRRQDSRVLLMFITNMAQYAIKGYEVDALDYVLKPLQYPAFCLKMHKALRLLRQREAGSVLLHTGGGEYRLSTDQVYYVEVRDHQLCYHTQQGEVRVRGGTMQQCEQDLAGYGFARCNNCYLVNLQYVDRLEGDRALVCGQALQVSRPRRTAFARALIRYCGGAGAGGKGE